MYLEEELSFCCFYSGKIQTLESKTKVRHKSRRRPEPIGLFRDPVRAPQIGGELLHLYYPASWPKPVPWP